MAPRLTWSAWLVAAAVALPALAAAQAPDVSYTRYTVFVIPFKIDAGESRIRSVQLHVSADEGRTWQPVMTSAPEQAKFQFSAPRDGLYWFTVQTMDTQGRSYPPTLEGARPMQKVIVDTQPPEVRLNPQGARDGEVGVAWDVKDEHLDPASVRLDFKAQDGTLWSPLDANLPASGQKSWRPTTAGPFEVRVQARDRAGNQNERTVTLQGLPGAVPSNGYAHDPGSGGGYGGGYGTGAPAATRYVNSKRVALNYEVKEVGKSGVGSVELWYTDDAHGRRWQKYREETGPAKPPFLIDVSGEGLYGFSLVVRSGVGLGDRPPQVGEQPQVWVEVDLTKPVVHITGIDVGRGAEAGKLTINWTATDKNMKAQPISISYAEQAGGPWKSIATELDNNVDGNTGRHVWQMPTDVPYRFVVRVQAVDKAGNVGSDETAQPVVVDLAQPKGVILDVGVAPVRP